jgi:hypothetical protein
MSKQYKVIVWATGTVGRSALHHVLSNPNYHLVGVYAFSDEKNGVDAGELVGLPTAGVSLTTDRDAIIAMDADVVIYTPRMHFEMEDMDKEVIELLESGKSVVTPAGYWFPPYYGQEYVDRLEAACRKGNASLFGAGENPGFFLARLATVAASACSEVRNIALLENVDCTHHPSKPMIFDVLGFGKQPAELEAGSAIAAMLDRCFKEELSLVAHMLGVSVDGFDKTSRFGAVDFDVECAAGTIPKGTVVAQSHCWSALKGDRPVMSITNTWFVYDEVPGWDLEDHWLVKVDGRPSMTIDTHATTTLEQTPLAKYADTDSGPMDTITAMTCVNAIPTVCNSSPGIVYPSVFGSFNVPALTFIE